MRLILHFLFAASLLWIEASCFAGFTSLSFEDGNGNENCLYFSQDGQFPFMTVNEATDERFTNAAEVRCKRFGLELATIRSVQEFEAILGAAKCSLADQINGAYLVIDVDTNTFIGTQGDPTQRCHFIDLAAGDIKSVSEGESCIRMQSLEKPEPKFICKKNMPCSSVPCSKHGEDKCVFSLGTVTGSEAREECQQRGGNLPFVSGVNDILTNNDLVFYDHLLDDVVGANYWVSLHFRGSVTPTTCSGSECDLSWRAADGQALALTKEHVDLFSNVSASESSECFRATLVSNDNLLAGNSGNGHALSGTDCGTETAAAFCELAIQSVPSGPPNLVQNLGVCQLPSLDPASGLSLAGSENGPYCSGDLLLLECDTGGTWNRFLDDPTKNSTTIRCGPDQQFSLPAEWPRCVAEPHCPEPPAPRAGLQHDWDGTSRIVGTTIQYSCNSPGAKVLAKEALKAQDDQSVMESLTVTCQDDGEYDINVDEFTCTKPCNLPNSAMKNKMQYTWTDPTPPQIGETISFSCLDGHKIVHRDHFDGGVENQEMDSVELSCQINGNWMPSLFNYTCTTDCAPPAKPQNGIVYDWNDGDSTAIGSNVIYSCSGDSDIVSLDTLEVLQEVTAVCLFNGRYSQDIRTFACTECHTPPNPANGRFICDSPTFAAGSTCFLQCDPGFTEAGKAKIECKKDEYEGTVMWDLDVSQLMCEKSVALVIGGVQEDSRYLNDVEVFAPNHVCHGKHLPPLPLALTGAATGALNGKVVVCGGAHEKYDSCSGSSDRGIFCETNTNCVETVGGSRWCSGPKTGECLMLEQSTQDSAALSWRKMDVALRRPRAFAAHVVLPDGTLWILGGVTANGIEYSTERVYFDSNRNTWRVVYGPNLPSPKFGHCAAILSDKENILITGGFGENSYFEGADLFNLRTGEWTSQEFLAPTVRERMDHACGTFAIRSERRTILVGGGNLMGAIDNAEVFDEDSEKWVPLSAQMPRAVRSAALAEINGTPMIIGGVRCNGFDCHRSSGVYQYVPDSGINATVIDDEWIEHGESLSMPRSGHAVVKVAENLLSPYCNREQNL